MKVLWISCLLIGSITCYPRSSSKGYGADNAVRPAEISVLQPFLSSPGYWYRVSGVSSGQDHSSQPPSLTYPSYGENTKLPTPQEQTEKLSSSGSSVNLGSLSPGFSVSSGSSSVNYLSEINSAPSPAYEPSSYLASFDTFQTSGGLANAEEGDSDSGYGFTSKGSNPSSSNVYSINVGNSNFDSGYGNPDASEHSNSYTGTEHAAYVASPGDGYEEADTSAPVGSYEPGYDGSYGYVDSNYLSAAEGAYEGSQDEDGSYGIGGGTSEESLEPVFSDTSDLQPLFSVSSRSSYRRGRTVFAQTHYTPGEFQPPVRPLSKGIVSQAVPAPRKPAKASMKGGF